jgi:4-alpha-glucanotransferase
MSTSPLSFCASETYEQALNRAAELWEIEGDYWDIWGNRHYATPEGIAAVLGSMGVDTRSRESIDDAVERRLWAQWSRVVPPTAVLSASTPELRVRLPRQDANATLRFRIEWEGGGGEEHAIELAGHPERHRATLRGREFVEKCALLPVKGRLGYHDLVTANGETMRLILTPDRAYAPESLRAGGFSVCLYGMRSSRNWGCGDFTDLKGTVEWAASALGVSFVGLNPLHAIPNRQPYNTSPYLPACTFYRNPIYLDIEAIEDFARSQCARRIASSPRVQREIALLRGAEFVEYERVYRLKVRILKLLFRTFLREYRQGSARSQAFKAYIREQGVLLDEYATYSALDEIIHKARPDVWLWTDWPREYQDPQSESTREFVRTHWRTVMFYKYIQWQINLQLSAAQRHAVDCGMAIGLYHDLALATDRFGGDLWAHRRFYVSGCRVGAPPDDFAPNGQDWSFPPPNSDAHFEDGYRLFVETIRKNLMHGGALRIDHVMRFFHLFWIPDGLDAKRGIYVRDRHNDLIRILALESVRNRVVVVGEDLGTVADEVRETLSRFGILSYRLFFFEKWPDGRMRLPREYPAQALVSASTHDLPTLGGFWVNRDIEARRRIGSFATEDDYRRQLSERMADKQRMLDALFAEGLLPKGSPRMAADYPELTGELHNAITGFLARTPSMLMLLSEEDLMKQCDQQNLPGTCEQYPNWRHKTRFELEELGRSPAKDFAAMYRGWLTNSGRRA